MSGTGLRLIMYAYRIGGAAPATGRTDEVVLERVP